MKKSAFRFSLPVLIAVTVLLMIYLTGRPAATPLDASDATSEILAGKAMNPLFAGLSSEDSAAIDLLADARAINAPERPQPATKFRSGHVTPGSLADHLEKTENGFKIDLKRSTQVPTPTVYKGKLYASGGFGSKIYHCFDARTGEVIWSINLDDDGPSSAVIEDDIIVFNTESCTIFACDANTGKMLWSYWLGDPLMSMPTIAKGKVFTAYPAGSYALNNIQNSYQNNLNNILPEEPDNNVQQEQNEAVEEAVQPKKVPAPADSVKSRLRPTHALIAIDLKTGKIEWQRWIDGDVMSAPVANGDELFVVTFPGTFYKFQQRNGEILSATASRATSAPVIVDNEIYYSARVDKDGEDATEALSTANKLEMRKSVANFHRKADYLNEEVQNNAEYKSQSMTADAGNGFGSGAPTTSGWKQAAMNVGVSNVSSLQSFQGARVLNYKDNNYSLRGDSLMCVTAKGGEPLWGIKLKGDLKKAGGFVGTPPLAVSGRLIIGTIEGDIVVYDARSGKEKSRYATGLPIRQQPVVDEGWIYAGTTQGKIVAIDTGDPTLTGWPVWGGDAAHSGVPVN